MKHTAKRVFSLLLAAILLAAALPVSGLAASLPFTDVKENNWFYDAVSYAYGNGLFSGETATTFAPNKSMTRAMFVTVLGRKVKVDQSKYTGSRFSDVSTGQYYAPYVEWAATYGIVDGTSATTFSPNRNVTREQMAAILYRFAQKTGNDVNFTTGVYESFPDKGSVASFAQEAFQWATSKGIINGRSGRLQPKGTASRAEVSQVFMTSKDVLLKTEITGGEVTPNPDDNHSNIPSGDRYLFDNASTADRSLGGVLFAAEAPQTKKTQYRTAGGKSGSKYAAPASFPLLQASISSSEGAYAQSRIGKNGLTQNLINSYGNYQFSEFIRQLDSRISAQWGGFRGNTGMLNMVSDANGSSVRSSIRRENQSNYTKTRIAECYAAFGNDPAYRTTASGIAAQAEMAADTLESAGASYYFCFISNGSLCIVYR